MAASLLLVLPAGAAIIPPFPPKPLTLGWDYPADALSADLGFSVYQSLSSLTPAYQWTAVTNVPGSTMSIGLTSHLPSGFFAVAASNYWGLAEPWGPPVSTEPKTVTLAWDYETNADAGLVFNLYHSADPAASPYTWDLFKVIPGTERSTTVSILPGRHIFSLTASNSLGESDFSNEAGTPPLPQSAPVWIVPVQ